MKDLNSITVAINQRIPPKVHIDENGELYRQYLRKRKRKKRRKRTKRDSRNVTEEWLAKGEIAKMTIAKEKIKR